MPWSKFIYLNWIWIFQFDAALQIILHLTKCQDMSPLLIGRVNVYQGNISWEEAERNNKVLRIFHNARQGYYEFPYSQQVLPGGRFVPKHCRSQSRVAIIIPYRKREEQLKLFLNHIHPILSRQQIIYGIYVVGQVARLNSQT